MVRLPPKATYLYLLQNVKTGSGAQPAFCSVGTVRVMRPGSDPNHSHHLLSMLGLSGAVPPFPHMPLWRTQGQHSAHLLSQIRLQRVSLRFPTVRYAVLLSNCNLRYPTVRYAVLLSSSNLRYPTVRYAVLLSNSNFNYVTTTSRRNVFARQAKLCRLYET